MNDKDSQLRLTLMEAMLAYIEGRRTFRSVLVLGVTAHNSDMPPKDPNIAEVVAQLNSLGQQIDKIHLSRNEKEEVFTDMLQKLTKD